MHPFTLQSMRRARRLVPFLAALVVLALLVAVQDLHVPMAQGDAGMAVAMADGGHDDGHDHAGGPAATADPAETASGTCAGSICALCLALMPDTDLDPVPAQAGMVSMPLLASHDAFVERLYRPPIPFA